MKNKRATIKKKESGKCTAWVVNDCLVWRLNTKYMPEHIQTHTNTHTHTLLQIESTAQFPIK